LNNIPDVQSEKPKIPIPISRVFLTDISLPGGEVVFDGRKITLNPEIKAGINLPHSQRGVHASRIYEAVKYSIELLNKQLRGFEDLASTIAEELLRKNSYATHSYVSLKATTYYTQRTPVTNFETIEKIRILEKAEATRRADGGIKVNAYLGAATIGMTACPCAKEIVRSIFNRLTGNQIDKDLPLGTHMQRTYGRIMVEKFNGLKLFDLIDIISNSMSSRTFELLKREDEARVVIDAIDNPKFVEDVAREIIIHLISKYPYIPDDTTVEAHVKALESIHSHNLAASITIKVGEVKNLMRKKLGVEEENL